MEESISFVQQDVALASKLDVCLIELHLVEDTAIAHDLAQWLTAQGARLQGLLLSLHCSLHCDIYDIRRKADVQHEQKYCNGKQNMF